MIKPHNTGRASQKSSQTTNDITDSQDEIIQKQNQVKSFQIQFNPFTSILSNLQKKSSFYQKQRRLIINRINYILSQHNISFKLYGSASSGAALPCSDIDIVIDASIVDYFYFSYGNYRKKIINSLEYIQRLFEKFEWVDDFMLLPNAVIPLLSFVIYFLLLYIEQVANSNVQVDYESKQKHANFLYNNKKIYQQEIKISIDITIEPYINMTDQIPLHLGIQSTEMVKEWINTYQHVYYKEILLLLKIVNKNFNLNKIYHGGIGSFMQCVILAAFFKVYLKDKEDNYISDTKTNIINRISNNNELKDQSKQQIKFQSSPKLIQILRQYCLFIIGFDQETQYIDLNTESTINKILLPNNNNKQPYIYTYLTSSHSPKQPDSLITPQISPILKPASSLIILNPLTNKIISQRCSMFKQYKNLINELYEIVNDRKCTQYEIQKRLMGCFRYEEESKKEIHNMVKRKHRISLVINGTI